MVDELRFEVQIRVSGPGGCIGTEMTLIRQLFEQHGIPITTTDTHKYPDPIKFPFDCGLELMKKNAQIHLIADHQPWGG